MNGASGGGWLDRIERAGNALPDPATLFAIGALLVALGSERAWRLDWQVEKTVSTETVTVQATRLLSSDGVYWMLNSLVKNFIEFPPLGVVRRLHCHRPPPWWSGPCAVKHPPRAGRYTLTI